MISCILPTYNRPKALRDRLNELTTALKYYNHEVVIVQDGFESIKREELDISYPNLNTKLITLEENSGSVTIPRNIGIDNSNGNIIAHIDDDVSICAMDKFIKLMNSEFLCNPNAKLIHGLRMERRVNADFTPDINSSTYIPNQPRLWKPLESWGVDGGQFIYKREVYNKFGYVFCRRGCDWELAKAIANHYNQESIISINDFVCTYMWHGNNRSSDESTKLKPIYPNKFRKYFKNKNLVLPEEI